MKSLFTLGLVMIAVGLTLTDPTLDRRLDYWIVGGALVWGVGWAWYVCQHSDAFEDEGEEASS